MIPFASIRRECCDAIDTPPRSFCLVDFLLGMAVGATLLAVSMTFHACLAGEQLRAEHKPSIYLEASHE
jgi:hypothetical protein